MDDMVLFIAFIFIVLLNVIAFAAFGIDKYLAVRNYRRISEKTLLRLAFFGGSAGAIAGQKMFRHKTRKFKKILWGIFLLHITVICGVFLYVLKI